MVKLTNGHTSFNVGSSGGAYFSNPQDGTKAMACPHCGRILDVDIDDILPVHSKMLRIFVPAESAQPDPLEELCAGSWSVKGELMKVQFYKTDTHDAP